MSALIVVPYIHAIFKLKTRKSLLLLILVDVFFLCLLLNLCTWFNSKLTSEPRNVLLQLSHIVLRVGPGPSIFVFCYYVSECAAKEREMTGNAYSPTLWTGNPNCPPTYTSRG